MPLTFPPGSGGGGSGDMLAANNLSDVASAATSRTNLGLAIGTDVQAYDADLTTWAGVTPAANVTAFLADPTLAKLNTMVSDADVAQLGANTFTALQTITQAAANTGVLASTGYSLTGSDATSMINLAGTWNTTGTPTAFKLNITNTASNGSSNLMDLQAGGVSQFKVQAGGTTQGLYAYFSAYILGGSTFMGGGGIGGAFVGANAAVAFTANAIAQVGDIDVILRRQAANILQLRNSTAAQSFTLANTWTSATNYEFGVLDWQGASNVFRVGTQKGSGGGTARDMVFITDDTERIRIKASGAVLFEALPTSDPGISGQFYKDSGTGAVFQSA